MQEKLRAIVSLTLILVGVAACQSPPPTQYLLEVTREVTRVVVVTPTPDPDESTSDNEATDDEATVVAVAPDSSATSPAPEASPMPEDTPAPTPTNDPFPDPIINEIIVAEQIFENGRMFYIEPTDEIWVLENGTDNTAGEWFVFPNTWEEGMLEFDPNIEVPEGLFQPERGFGKLWRENAEVGDAVGWALESEVGHVTTYTYVYGGEVNANNVYVQGPGFETLNSWYGGTFVFNEADDTWRFEPDESG